MRTIFLAWTRGSAPPWNAFKQPYLENGREKKMKIKAKSVTKGVHRERLLSLVCPYLLLEVWILALALLENLGTIWKVEAWRVNFHFSEW